MQQEGRYLHVLGRDGYCFPVDATQLCFLKQSNHICLRSFLNGNDRLRGESNIGLEALCYLPDHPLEWALTYEELR